MRVGLRVGVVLGSGGSKGYAWHVGVLAALEQAVGVDPADAEVVVGTSAGAIAAGFVRTGRSAQELWTDIHERPQPTSARGLLADARTEAPVRPRRPARPGIGRPAHPALLGLALRRRTRLLAGLSGLLPDGTGDAYGFVGPLADDRGWPGRETLLCAVRVSDGQRVVFGSAGAPAVSVGSAAAASAAIPGIVAPVLIDGQGYLDGAVWSPTSVDLIRDRALDVLVVSAPMHDPRSRLLLRRELRGASAERVLVLVPSRRLADRRDAAQLGRSTAMTAADLEAFDA